MRLNGLFARLALASCALITACAGDSTALHRYMLPTSDGTQNGADAGGAALLVTRPQLSGLIDRRGLLMQVDDIEIREASAHQWADDLAAQLRHSLSRALADSTQDWRIISNGKAGNSKQLRVFVQQFQGRYDGQAIVSGQWQLLDADRTLLDEQSFWFAEPLQQAGYPDLVRSLNAAWLRLAEQIAQRLQPLPTHAAQLAAPQ